MERANGKNHAKQKMNRQEQIAFLKSQAEWDVVVIGGGATGLGTALDALSRGLKVALIEKFDFAKGTSSRSTKLVHGGVRYLKNGDIALVREALHERGLLLQNAPHLCRDMHFIIPSYSVWHKWFYGIGLKVYDALSGKLSLGKSKILSKQAVIESLPGVKTDGLKGGVLYHDGQFDDARLAISMAKTIVAKGGCVLNYCEWLSFQKNENGKITGLTVRDTFKDDTFDLKAKIVINAAGVFAEHIMEADEGKSQLKIRPSQGVHIVLDASFSPGQNALMVPSTTDGRVLFAVPWHNALIVGTTDTEVKTIETEPKSTEEEVQFILENARLFLAKKPERSDIKSVFAGLRPLISAEGKSSKALSRKHVVHEGKSGLINILGGKWTTYRSMAKDAVDQALASNSISSQKSQTEHLHFVGYQEKSDWKDPLHVYGSEREKLDKFGSTVSFSEVFFICEAQIKFAVLEEMALTLEDVLCRRIRCMLLNAAETIKIAPNVVAIMAETLGETEAWKTQQLNNLYELFKKYSL